MFTANQLVLATSPLRPMTSIFLIDHLRLVFINCCWHSPAQSFAGLMTIFHCVRFEIPQPVGPGPRIYTPQKQGGPVIPPGTGFTFRRLLRLAGILWRYSNPPPHRIRWTELGRSSHKPRSGHTETTACNTSSIIAWRHRVRAYPIAP
jgi:hypothetical protein